MISHCPFHVEFPQRRIGEMVGHSAGNPPLRGGALLWGMEGEYQAAINRMGRTILGPSKSASLDRDPGDGKQAYSGEGTIVGA